MEVSTHKWTFWNVYYHRALYLEQCFVTMNTLTKEEFISAIALVKWVPVKVNVKEMMEMIFGTKRIIIDSKVNSWYIIITKRLSHQIQPIIVNKLCSDFSYRRTKKFDCSLKWMRYHPCDYEDLENITCSQRANVKTWSFLAMVLRMVLMAHLEKH